MVHLELVAGKSSKFWEITLAARSFTARWGRIGTPGSSKKQTFKTAAEAKKLHDRLVAQKRAKGYRESAKAPVAAPAGARNAELEAAIRADRSDAGGYDVYADWLQAQGNAIGELIVLQQALAKKKADAPKRKRADAIIKGLALPDEKLATFGWRWGFWQWLRLENSVDLDAKFDALGLAAPLFAMPTCAALEELRIGILRWDENHHDVPAVLAEAGKHAWARDLRRLHLGDVSEDIDMAHHVIGSVGATISKAFPRLQSLKLHSGEQSWREKHTFVIGTLVLPELTELVIETCSLSKARLKEVLGSKLPKLERLELWFGSADQGADATLAALKPLLAGALFPKLRHLGLRNAEFEDKLARTIHTAPIARRLETLDLSMGTMDDAAAIELAKHAAAFPKLSALNVGDNFLTAAGIKALGAAFRGVKIASDDQREAYDELNADSDRFVSVAE